MFELNLFFKFNFCTANSENLVEFVQYKWLYIIIIIIIITSGTVTLEEKCHSKHPGSPSSLINKQPPIHDRYVVTKLSRHSNPALRTPHLILWTVFFFEFSNSTCLIWTTIDADLFLAQSSDSQKKSDGTKLFDRAELITATSENNSTKYHWYTTPF